MRVEESHLATGSERQPLVILTGTDPERPKGGIGVAVGGFRTALGRIPLELRVIPSYRPDSLEGRTILALRATRQIVEEVSAASRLGRDAIVYAHGGRGWGLARQAGLLWAAREAGARTLLHLHSFKLDHYVRSDVGRRFLHACLRGVDHVLVLSEYWRGRMEAFDPSIDVSVVPNVLPESLEAAAHSKARSRPEGEVRLLVMTRLVPGKGVDHVLESLALLPEEFQLVVAGEGVSRGSLEAQARALGISGRVHFAGWVTGSMKTEHLMAAHAFVLPSAEDSFGFGFVEAMAHGVPVVALRQGATPFVVPHGVAGELVPDASPDSIAAAVGRVVVEDAWTTYSEGGRRWVLVNYSAEVVAPMLSRVIDQVASR